MNIVNLDVVNMIEKNRQMSSSAVMKESNRSRISSGEMRSLLSPLARVRNGKRKIVPPYSEVGEMGGVTVEENASI